MPGSQSLLVPCRALEEHETFTKLSRVLCRMVSVCGFLLARVYPILHCQHALGFGISEELIGDLSEFQPVAEVFHPSERQSLKPHEPRTRNPNICCRPSRPCRRPAPGQPARVEIPRQGPLGCAIPREIQQLAVVGENGCFVNCRTCALLRLGSWATR